MASSSRSQYFDNAKFILIFLVVFGHVISPLKRNDDILFTLYTVIFLFHMPAFILISGYFSKSFNKKGHLWKSIKKILLPYIIFQVIYSVFYYWNGHESNLKFDLLNPHWTLWFLLSLFCWNLLLYVFARLKWVGLAIAVLIGIGIGYLDNVGSFLSLSRTFVFFPYFLLGYLLEPQHLQLVKKVRYSTIIGFTVLIGTMLLFGTLFPKDAVSWLLGDTSYAGMGTKEITDGLIRASQYFLTAIVIYGFLSIVPSGGFKLTVIGERTLYVYLLHGFIIKTIQSFVSNDTLDAMSDQYITLIILSFGICVFLGSYFIKKYTRPIIELKI
ncbi:acyltransferase family protein [Bacillus sp. FJAT-49736]|uniref:acyltransferase family protein n=1 Tax=Bacillus sp. FJAT-49736 TaxID=2833582 RepID=UPI001BC9B795|nr:acyltransferase family protein [Bacillus sp. FJAT-49736]MBS4171845.1 acyltransferase family protein [Bacillus sp. FJAT-49736]